MLTKAPRGTRDLFNNEVKIWRYVENQILDLMDKFGFGEVRTPVFEHTELFQRGVGETTDIVQKEMYSFQDKGGRDITLKPEGTAGAVRAYLENKMYAQAQPTKLFYLTPAFRYERPQAGRLRQFHQFGVEFFGSSEPTADVEVISIANSLLNKLGITNVELHINSLGGPECRQKYNEELKKFLEANKENLCSTCRERMEKNPLRVLDCKVEKCGELVKDAPRILDVLGDECREHFNKVQKLLEGLGIEYVVDPNIVRGLDYYTKTVFEFISKDIGSQGTICGGGRYDKLIEECGGSATPAVGFGIGLERLIMTMEAVNGAMEFPIERDIAIVSIGDAALMKAHSLVYKLRNAGISAEADHMSRSVKAQMKFANKIGAKYSIVIGDDEIESDKVALKNMNTKEIDDIKLSDLVDVMIAKVK